MKERGRILIMSSPVLMTALLLTAIGCQSGMPAMLTRSAGDSVWGNERETLTISGEGARFEGLCLEGVIPQKVAIDGNGNFNAHGTLRHAGGARRDDVAPQEVVYQGAIRGDTLTLTIIAADGSKLLESSLVKGARGNTHPCA